MGKDKVMEIYYLIHNEKLTRVPVKSYCMPLSFFHLLADLFISFKKAVVPFLNCCRMIIAGRCLKRGIKSVEEGGVGW